jgi:hypothetical protein
VTHAAAPTGTVPRMQLSSTPVTPPVDDTALAQFSYVLRGPRQLPKLGVIEARAWPTAPVAVAGGFEDAVAAARMLASMPVRDGLHKLPIFQAHGVLQGADGQMSVVPLGGFHRGVDGPLFIDGHMFEAVGLTLQVVRSHRDLVAVVGSERVLDLRHTGAAFAVSKHVDRPVSRPGRPSD